MGMMLRGRQGGLWKGLVREIFLLMRGWGGVGVVVQ